MICPYFQKVECGKVLSAQAYCMGYASGKLRVPILKEMMNFCQEEKRYRKCNTYRFAIKSNPGFKVSKNNYLTDKH